MEQVQAEMRIEREERIKEMLYLNGSKLWKTKCLGCYVWYFDKRQICMVKKLTNKAKKFILIHVLLLSH